MEKPFAGYVYFALSTICGFIIFFSFGYVKIFKPSSYLSGYGEKITELHWDFIVISILIIAQGWVVLTILRYLHHIAEK